MENVMDRIRLRLPFGWGSYAVEKQFAMKMIDGYFPPFIPAFEPFMKRIRFFCVGRNWLKENLSPSDWAEMFLLRIQGKIKVLHG